MQTNASNVYNDIGQYESLENILLAEEEVLLKLAVIRSVDHKDYVCSFKSSVSTTMRVCLVGGD